MKPISQMISHTKRILVTSILLLLFTTNIAFGQEKVSISLDGESYSREIPSTYDDAVKLIELLAELERNADLQFVEMSRKYMDSMNLYENKLSELYTKIESLELSLSEAKANAKKTEKDVNKLTSVNSRLTMGVDIGPVFGFDNPFIVGTHTGILFDYRILKNFHIGGNVSLNTFSSQTRPFELETSLFVGYSLY